MRRRAGAAAVLAVLALPAPAAATEVSAGQLRSLAARAPSDPAALRELRAVDAVDGRPTDVAGSLRGASGAQLRARLQALAAAPAAAPAAGAEPARADARRILSERRFTGTRLHGPFRGILDRIGRTVERLGDLIPRLDGALPGGRVVVWALMAAIVGGLAWLVAGRTLRRRAGFALAAGAPAAGAREEPPAALERRAEAAERAGDHEQALRLRFRAGLLRLDERGVIAWRPSLPTGEVARAVGSDAFDRLAARFDAVAYGARPAGAEDVEAARRDWDAVLEKAR